MRRIVLGWLLAAFGAITMTLAVAGCFWLHLTFHAGQFDLTPAWLVGSLVLAVDAALLSAGVWALLAKR